MPDIREEMDEPQQNDPNQPGAGGGTENAAGGGIPRIIVSEIIFRFNRSFLKMLFFLKEHLKGRKVDSFLWILRAATIVFGILYVFPIK